MQNAIRKNLSNAVKKKIFSNFPHLFVRKQHSRSDSLAVGFALVPIFLYLGWKFLTPFAKSRSFSDPG